VELIKDRLPSELINKYRSGYRTVTMGSPQMPARVYFEDGRALSEKEFITSTDLFFIWVLSEFIPFANSLGRPWMLVHGDTPLLEKLDLSQEELRAINGQGLLIFMYEPLFILNADRSWPWSPHNGSPTFADLDIIQKFKTRVAPLSSFYVLLCEHGMSKYLLEQGYYPDLICKDFSTLLMHEVHMNTAHVWPVRPFDDIEKKLICLNFRYESAREMLVGFIRGSGFQESCFLSFFHSHLPSEYTKRTPFNPYTIKKWPVIQQGIQAMQAELPYVLDTQNSQLQDPVKGSFPDLNPEQNRRDNNKIKHDFYTKSFAFAYCESRPYSPRGELSEKTIHPILAMKPFVPFASRYFLKNLRRLGFKTFSEFWDESYDEIEDNGDRLDAFLDVIHFICSQDLATLKDWGRKMNTILEHNRLHMMRQLVPSEKSRIQKDIKRWKFDDGSFY
jgi:hypothetical protein